MESFSMIWNEVKELALDLTWAFLMNVWIICSLGMLGGWCLPTSFIVFISGFIFLTYRIATYDPQRIREEQRIFLEAEA